MISLGQVTRITKRRPLTAREKAILYYWNWAEGKFTLSNKEAKLSEVLLSYSKIYSEKELENATSPFISEDEIKEFRDWQSLINLTLDYDHNSEIFFQKSIGLLNERSLCIYRPHKNSINERYSLILDRKVDIFQINDEFITSLFMFYRFVVYILIHHSLLSNAFNLPDDMLCIKNLIKLSNLRKTLDESDSGNNLIVQLLLLFKENDDELILDHLHYLRCRYLGHSNITYGDNFTTNVTKSVEENLNAYYPNNPIVADQEHKIFPELEI